MKVWEDRVIFYTMSQFHTIYFTEFSYSTWLFCWKHKQEGGDTGWVLQRRHKGCPCCSSCTSPGQWCFEIGMQCSKVQSEQKHNDSLPWLFRSSSHCPVLSTLQERSGPSEEDVDITPNKNRRKHIIWGKAEENGVAPPNRKNKQTQTHRITFFLAQIYRFEWQ